MKDLNWRTRCYSLQDINNQLEKENEQYRQQIRDLKEELETEQNLNDSERTIVIPELENRIKQYKQQIDELIKKYENEFDNLKEMQKDWELDKAKTDDENYKYYCEDVISDCRTSRNIYRQVISDLSKLKEHDKESL